MTEESNDERRDGAEDHDPGITDGATIGEPDGHGQADDTAEAAPRLPGQPEGPKALTVDYEAEYRVGVVCPCECGMQVMLGAPNAVQAALIGGKIRAVCGSCKKAGMFSPSPDSPRMRPPQMPGPNRQQRRAAEAQARRGAPPGFKRDGHIIVPR